MNPEDPIQPTAPVPQPVQPPIPEPVPEILPTAAAIEQPPLVHEIPKPKHKFAIFVIILLILTSLGSLGYWAYQKNFTKPPVIPAESPTPSASQAPNGDLANWKTYTSSLLGYSIKYPKSQSQKYLNCSNSQSGNKNFDFIWANNSAGCDGQGENFVFTITKYGSSEFECKDTEGWKSTKTETQFAGTSAVKCEHNFIGQRLYPGPDSFMDIFIINKNINIQLLDKKYLDIFDQILSTFRFLSSSLTDDRTTLLQYLTDQYYSQSKQYGYSRDQVIIKISKIEGNFATGTGNISDSGGDVWFAAKIDGQWKIVEQTQEPPSCTLMTQYNFPKSIYQECVNK